MESEFAKLLGAPEYIPASRVSVTSISGSFDVTLKNDSSKENLQPVEILFMPEAGDIQKNGTEVVQSESFTVVSKESIGDVTVIENKNFNQAVSAVDESHYDSKIPKKKAASTRQLESPSKVSSSRPATSHESIRREMSQISLTSGASRGGATTAKLPHQLGSIPSYMAKTKIGGKPTSAGSTSNKYKMSSITTVHPTVSTVSSSADSQKYLAVMAKANEYRGKLSEMCKQNDTLKKKLEESEKLSAEKEAKLADFQRKFHLIESQKRAQMRENKKTDSLEKVKKLEEENASLAAQNEELTKKVAQKDGALAKIRFNSQRLEKESEKKSTEIEALVAERKQLEPVEGKRCSDHDIQRVSKLEKQVKELKVQLMQRDAEIADLKRDASGVVDVLHKSISSASKASQKSVVGDANQVKKLIQENHTLKSQLDDERQKNFRVEDILQVRGEFIKTLQDTDELQKMRLIVSASENEKLQAKLKKVRAFKVAKAEELANLHSTLQQSQMENARLMGIIEHKQNQALKRIDED